MLNDKTTEFIVKMLNTPPVDFDKVFQDGHTTLTQDDVSLIERAAEHLAMIGAYLDGRISLQIGHTSAVRMANRVRKAVRKAQGYNITPDISF